ncbi:DsbA family protein [Actinacidiphila glaucinigra]|uniref:DsbA family protein n=1 Tax=Actinacidiphila glaucinigra TaxID=235986 RepID=UPI0033ABB4D9
MVDNLVGDTWAAHEFLAHATAQGKNRGAWDAIFCAYFGEARRICDVDVLLDLADDLGIDRETTGQAFPDGRFRQRVREEAQVGRRLGRRSSSSPAATPTRGHRTATLCSTSCARSWTRPTRP